MHVHSLIRFGRRNHCFGFTLVEMLVVMVVVVLLLAVLIPTLSKARETAYIALCGNNLRQSGIAMGGYAAEWKGSIPPNIGRTDGIDPTYGPYSMTGPFQYFAANISGAGFVRMDDSNDAAYTWTSGLGVMWSTGNIPYDLGGARLFWCPAERRANFMGTSKTSSMNGPGTRWFSAGGVNKGLIDHVSSVLANSGAGSWTVVSSYDYRSMGASPATSYSPQVTFGKGVSRGSWQLDAMAPYTALVDGAANIYNTLGQSPLPNYSHGTSGNAYIGMNKLGYDGHAKWINDPSASWQMFDDPLGAIPHFTGYGNANNAAQWTYFDTIN